GNYAFIPSYLTGSAACQGFKHVFSDIERFVDDGGVVRARPEARFEGGRCEVHAAFQHAVEETLEQLDVGIRHFGESGGPALAEIDTEHAADGVGAEGQP